MMWISIITFIICFSLVYVFYIYMCYLKDREDKEDQKEIQKSFNKLSRPVRRKIVKQSKKKWLK